MRLAASLAGCAAPRARVASGRAWLGLAPRRSPPTGAGLGPDPCAGGGAEGARGGPGCGCRRARLGEPLARAPSPQLKRSCSCFRGCASGTRLALKPLIYPLEDNQSCPPPRSALAPPPRLSLFIALSSLISFSLSLSLFRIPPPACQAPCPPPRLHLIPRKCGAQPGQLRGLIGALRSAGACR